ncbi:hypothetical protein O9G_001818 [Rozella allomycis CSF55]|uniref:Uncharacterized protein n=1 Tax=Rozella allomycis (strain CSF55) TaxID=988480 RepID=A0A075AWN1_ROZAC|nr:hypothetical protein O9G_001818 [Rozella allomycis CSF55]|eukprot:EPZ34562.1 hypothetical protein O9G_001818 [Rozella allomycis CSF55]
MESKSDSSIPKDKNYMDPIEENPKSIYLMIHHMLGKSEGSITPSMVRSSGHNSGSFSNQNSTKQSHSAALKAKNAAIFEAIQSTNGGDRKCRSFELEKRNAPEDRWKSLPNIYLNSMSQQDGASKRKDSNLDDPNPKPRTPSNNIAPKKNHRGYSLDNCIIQNSLFSKAANSIKYKSIKNTKIDNFINSKRHEVEEKPILMQHQVRQDSPRQILDNSRFEKRKVYSVQQTKDTRKNPLSFGEPLSRYSYKLVAYETSVPIKSEPNKLFHRDFRKHAIKLASIK